MVRGGRAPAAGRSIVILVVYASHVPPNAGPVVGWVGDKFKVNTPEERSAWKRGAAMACLVLAASGYAAWTILALARRTPQSDSYPSFLGLVATPIALVVLAFFLALAGVGWKSESTKARRVTSAIFLILGAAALLGSHLDRAIWRADVADGWQWGLILVAAVLRGRPSVHRMDEPRESPLRGMAWSGRGGRDDPRAVRVDGAIQPARSGRRVLARNACWISSDQLHLADSIGTSTC